MATLGSPFVGRVTELAALADAFTKAAAGHPAIVCVEGTAGIGKTALVRAGLAAAEPGLVVLASGDEAETTLPWGVLAQLARSVPVEGARPLRELGELSPGDDPLAVGALLLDALESLSSRRPVALIVEDLHWADQPSAQSLRFALRRLSTEPVLAVLTTRPEGPAQADEGWRRLLDDQTTRVRLDGLRASEVAELAAAMGAGDLSGTACRRLWQHTGGNPLYVRCLLQELAPAVLEAAPGPLPAPRSLATLLVVRLGGCAQATQDLVAAAGVLGEHCPLGQAAALARLADPAEALGEALIAGFLEERPDGQGQPVGFPHPLVRAAIYADLSPARRAALHRSAARLTSGAVALAHRIAATIGPDEDLAAELAALADAEITSGHYASAARHLRQAADLSAEPTSREDRLLAAGRVWLRSGAVPEVSSCRPLIEALPPSPRRDHLLGFLAHLEGRSCDARRAFRAALDQLQATGRADPVAAEAAPRLAGLAVFEWNWQAALDLAGSAPCRDSPLSLLITGLALTLGGRAADARELLAGARAAAPPGRGDVLERLASGFARAWSGDLAAARRDLEAIVQGPPGFGGSLRSAASWLLADVYYRLGALSDAMVTADLARALLEDTGRARSPEIAMAWAVGAYAASARGDWADATALARRAAAQATPAASRFEQACGAAARWSVAVARDDPELMLGAGPALAAAADVPELSLFPFGPVLAEALWRSGQLDQAADHLAGYETRAHQLGRACALVAAARVRGLLEAGRADPAAALRAFADTAAIADTLDQPMVVARFKAAHGFVLARFGQRAAGAAQAAQARDILQRLGARPYLDRAERLLERLGGRASRGAPAGQFTATELVVARLVVAGLSNREVAERLLVSRKAVEYHLTNIYAKAGVSSRSQLAARLDPLGAPRMDRASDTWGFP